MKAAATIPLVLLLHGAVLVVLLGALALARHGGLSFDTFALPPQSLIELAMREIQAHPEEGIHALARVQLPAMAGALHLLMLALWAGTTALALRAPRAVGTRALLLLFPLAMLQDTAFLTLEHVQPAALVQAIYLAALAATLCAEGTRLWCDAALVLALGWLTVRMLADVALAEGTTLLAVETYAGLMVPALWAVYLGGLSDADGARA